MNNVKRVLLMFAFSLVGCAAITVFAANQSSIFQNTIADGTIVDGKDRATTFDDKTSISFVGTTGDATAGNIGLHTTYCESLDGGVCKSKDTAAAFYLYCSTAGLNGDYYHGFEGTKKINSITFKVNTHNAPSAKIVIGWVKLDKDFNRSSYESNTDVTFTQTSVDQTKTISEGNFFTYSGTSNCIYFYSNKAPIDLVSLTINYTCL